uniref:Oxidoreductase n=1 Tax=Parastrongyloides trichosuri TaxID=131310 RepID=A0A0N4Z552_PARTI
LADVAGGGFGTGQPALQRGDLLGRRGEAARGVGRGQLHAGGDFPTCGGLVDLGAVNAGAADFIDHGAAGFGADDGAFVDRTGQARFLGEGGHDGHGVVIGGQAALRTDVGVGVASARLFGRIGQHHAVGGLRRRRGQQQIARTGGARDFVQRLLVGGLAQQDGLADLAVGVGGRQHRLGAGLNFFRAGRLGLVARNPHGTRSDLSRISDARTGRGDCRGAWRPVVAPAAADGAEPHQPLRDRGWRGLGRRRRRAGDGGVA